MRQINILSQAIARALALRADNRDGEAMQELDRAIEDLSESLEPRETTVLDAYQLAVTPQGKLQPYAYDLAFIQSLRGDSFAESGRLGQARDAYATALRIYESVLQQPEMGMPWDIRERIDSLKERLKDVHR